MVEGVVEMSGRVTSQEMHLPAFHGTICNPVGPRRIGKEEACLLVSWLLGSPSGCRP